MKKLLLIIPLCCSLLTGCLPLVVTGVGATAIVANKSLKRHFSDSDISFSINNAIFGNKQLYANNHISVNVYHGEVLLTGQVLNEDYHQQLLKIVNNAEGVTKIYDQLTVGALTSFKQRTQDTVITTNVKARILGNVGTGITVITEDGVVYLMGTVSREKSDKATEIARTSDGVKKVVRIFNYTTS